MEGVHLVSAMADRLHVGARDGPRLTRGQWVHECRVDEKIIQLRIQRLAPCGIRLLALSRSNVTMEFFSGSAAGEAGGHGKSCGCVRLSRTVSTIRFRSIA